MDLVFFTAIMAKRKQTVYQTHLLFPSYTATESSTTCNRNMSDDFNIGLETETDTTFSFSQTFASRPYTLPGIEVDVIGPEDLFGGEAEGEFLETGDVVR